MTLKDAIIPQSRLAGIVYEVNRQMFGLYRIIAHEGGTRSGKTYNTIEFLVDVAFSIPGIEITIASRDMPHLKRGCIKDFEKIMRDRKVFNEYNWNKTDKVYRFPNGAIIEFFNADDLGKVSGPGRDILFVNECNFLQKLVFHQLLLRTRMCCILDYNPIHPRHWIYDTVLTRPDCYTWKSSYKDNKFLPKEQIDEIEMMKITDPLMWRVYGLGLRGAYQKGQIYGQNNNPWKPITIQEFNSVRYDERVGLDWGFSNDPNAALGVKAVGRKRFIRCLNYKAKQKNKQLVKALRDKGCTSDTAIIADTSDNKSIEDIREMTVKEHKIEGFPLTYQAIKPPGSLATGIKKIQGLAVFYVPDPDIEFEYYNYCWALAPGTDEPTNKPIDKYNHLMDAFRYVEGYEEYL